MLGQGASDVLAAAQGSRTTVGSKGPGDSAMGVSKVAQSLWAPVGLKSGSGFAMGVSKAARGSRARVGSKSRDRVAIVVNNSDESSATGSPLTVLPSSATSSRPAVSRTYSSMSESEGQASGSWKPAEDGKIQDRKIIKTKRGGRAGRAVAGEVRHHGHTFAGIISRTSMLS